MLTLIVVLAAYALALSVALARAGVRSSRRGPVAATGESPKRLLIVGATGGTGRELVAQALERGYTVTALVRNPSRLPLTHPRLVVAVGNVLDYDSVESAMRGQDAVLSALGHKRFFGPTRILSDGTANVLRAMEANGVRRMVCETSLGIGSSAGRMGLPYTFFVIPLILPFYFWDKTRQEQRIAASNREWVIVRPGALTNGASRGACRHGFALGSFLWTVRISRADVADFMLNQVEEDTYLQSAVSVCW